MVLHNHTDKGGRVRKQSASLQLVREVSILDVGRPLLSITLVQVRDVLIRTYGRQLSIQLPNQGVMHHGASVFL